MERGGAGACRDGTPAREVRRRVAMRVRVSLRSSHFDQAVREPFFLPDTGAESRAEMPENRVFQSVKRTRTRRFAHAVVRVDLRLAGRGACVRRAGCHGKAPWRWKGRRVRDEVRRSGSRIPSYLRTSTKQYARLFRFRTRLAAKRADSWPKRARRARSEQAMGVSRTPLTAGFSTCNPLRHRRGAPPAKRPDRCRCPSSPQALFPAPPARRDGARRMPFRLRKPDP